MLETYIVCDACGLWCPSFESSSVLYITPTDTEICGMDDVFRPDDLRSGLYTPFIVYIPYFTAAI